MASSLHLEVRRIRPAAVWLSGIALYLLDFAVKRAPLWRPPLNVEIGIDRLIPFVPQWGWVYMLVWLLFLFGAGGRYIIEQWEDWGRVRELLLAAVLMQVGAWMIHLSIPTYMPRPTGQPLPWIMAHIYGSDPPTNALPSLHMASVWVAGWFYARCRRPGRVLLSAACIVLVLLSVLFTKQHGVLDVVAGIAWGHCCCRAGVYGNAVLEVVTQPATSPVRRA